MGKYFSKRLIREEHSRDFPGSPVVRTPCFHCREWEFNPWPGTEILQAARHGQNMKKKECSSTIYNKPRRVQAAMRGVLTQSVSSVAQSCPTLWDPMDSSTPGLPVHHQLLEFTQAHVHQVSDAIQPSHPLPSPSPPAFNLSQHQGLF